MSIKNLPAMARLTKGVIKEAQMLAVGVLMVGLAVALGPTPSVYAFGLLVNSAGDQTDANLGDGICQTANNNCTLRAAIMEANTSALGSTITFSSNMTITPGSPLPPLTVNLVSIIGQGAVVLDGSSLSAVSAGLELQGSSFHTIQTLEIRNFTHGILIEGVSSIANRNVIGTNGDGINDATEGLTFTGNNTAVTIIGAFATGNIVAGNQIGPQNQTGVVFDDQANGNLIGTDGDGVSDNLERNVISGNEGVGILLGSGASDNIVSGNYIGLAANGTALGNGADGVKLTGGAHHNVIGTNSDGVGDDHEGNVISANLAAGIVIEGVSRNRIAGNYIGTDSSGSNPMGNSFSGIWVVDSDNHTIGADGDGISDTVEANVISANGSNGIVLLRTFQIYVTGNFIGTDNTASIPLGNGDHGVVIVPPEEGDSAGLNVIGGQKSITSSQFSPDLGNVIAYNQHSGIIVNSTGGGPESTNTILYNAIFSNGDLGIDLDQDGVTFNDFLDPDTGPHSLQNFPQIQLASSNGVSTFIQAAMFDTIANEDYRVQFFSSPACDPSGFGEGKLFLGEAFVTTDGNGNAPFGPVSFPGATLVGHFVTATASVEVVPGTMS